MGRCLDDYRVQQCIDVICAKYNSAAVGYADLPKDLHPAVKRLHHELAESAPNYEKRLIVRDHLSATLGGASFREHIADHINTL